MDVENAEREGQLEMELGWASGVQEIAPHGGCFSNFGASGFRWL